MSNSQTVVRTENLTKRFGDLLALENINVQIKRGEIYGLLGHNGAGKTTLISILLGLIPATRGGVYLFGETYPKRRVEVMSRIGVMGEEQHFYEDMTAYEYLALFADLHGVIEKKTVIEGLLEKMSLITRRNHLIKTFSHGMRQKLSLARALLNDPEVLFLDEPVSGLDPYGIRGVRELLFELKQKGVTIFISSHILSEVERIADRVGILARGRLLAEGPVHRLNELAQEKTVLEVEYTSTKNGIGSTLRQLPYVYDLQEDGQYLRIEMDANEDHRRQISETITKMNGVILGMSLQRSSLEDTFLTLTERNAKLVAELVKT